MSKRFSDLMELEIIDVSEGSKFGTIGDCDIVFNRLTGEIESLITASNFSLFSFKNRDYMEIPWNKRINVFAKTILFDLKTKF
ncbi:MULTISPECIES: YlmC/YmxH family sporulation protein [Caloramator]|jgi:YlmC/YmxH family sporulation protein|uniref:Sporulation protein, YlmC/YmxH family n=1 Tax=Caloramator proteoclasticus DSM 10124 TaxID=1121262 RepID=A0A1M4SNE3_9CLOT|nr:MULTISPECIES: YlmC/YmxH family sporulation protein [Caloramator]MCX7695854.1 YlmC/YmxH family sporulation protein [Caloramator sp.]SHE33689.1 sporulation protein, YlmC/YmxH family [Caloramator proteoclasticus DSM 10124]